MSEQPKNMGHNNPPLEERIFLDDEVTVEAVLSVVKNHILREREESVVKLEERAKTLASNAKRLPKELKGEDLDKALDLLSDMGNHSSEAGDEKEAVVKAAKETLDALTKRCKNLEAGFTALEKTLRPLIEEALTSRLAEQNKELGEDDKPYASYTHRAQSGAKATITVNSAPSISDESKIPRQYLVPDMKAIEKDFSEGKEIPGIVSIDKASLRLYKSG